MTGSRRTPGLGLTTSPYRPVVNLYDDAKADVEDLSPGGVFPAVGGAGFCWPRVPGAAADDLLADR